MKLTFARRKRDTETARVLLFFPRSLSEKLELARADFPGSSRFRVIVIVAIVFLPLARLWRLLEGVQYSCWMDERTDVV